MSELSEDFAAMREESKIKRATNRENSAEILKRWGVPFESKNNGAHLIVDWYGKMVDFWPGTGKFICRNGQYSGRGVFRMLGYLGVPVPPGGVR